eukprot:1158329-Pelagomonas_calceolata.AAC.8
MRELVTYWMFPALRLQRHWQGCRCIALLLLITQLCIMQVIKTVNKPIRARIHRTSMSLAYAVAAVVLGSSIEHGAQPPSCYGTLVKREEGDNKEEVPGSNPCDRGGDRDTLYRWEPVGGSFLNARGKRRSFLSFFLSLLGLLELHKVLGPRQATVVQGVERGEGDLLQPEPCLLTLSIS